MHVAVVGAGVIGVSTAYYLRQAGCDVTVIERRASAGCETSFANAGQVSWGYAAPWAAPGIPLKALKWLFARHAPLVLRPRIDPDLWRWLIAMLGECTADRYRLNKQRMLLLARFSRDCLADLREALGLHYDNAALGTLQLLRDTNAVSRAREDIRVLEDSAIPFETLDRLGCITAEPALARVADKFVAGLRLPGDETGDCFKFTQALAAEAARLGVRFEYRRPVTGLRVSSGHVEAVELEDGEVVADACVVAAGCSSVPLVRALGIRLPVVPVKGYSATLELTNTDAGPRSTIMDEAYKVAVTRLGNRLRAAGTAELAGDCTWLDPRRCATIDHVIADLFPDAGRLDGVVHWTGLRPMTPDGTPVIGATPVPNLFLNTGHGTLGWTMACGSARLLADVMTGQQPAIAPDAYRISRYQPAPRGRLVPAWAPGRVAA